MVVHGELFCLHGKCGRAPFILSKTHVNAQNSGRHVLLEFSPSSRVASATNSLLLPFPAGETWYICQGYNGRISHRGTIAVDISVDPRSPMRDGCNPATARSSGGRTVTSPGRGNLYRDGSEGVCINFDMGRSMYINHVTITHRNGRVEAGAVIGRVNPPGVGKNGGYAHMHIQMHSGHGCGRSPKIPLQFQNAPSLPYNPNAVNQHSGVALTRPRR
jgi:hypothetical protein